MHPSKRPPNPQRPRRLPSPPRLPSVPARRRSRLPKPPPRLNRVRSPILSRWREVRAELAPEPDAKAEPVAKAEPAAVAAPVIEAEPEDDTITFSKLGRSEALLESITSVGYEEPTPIQAMTIPKLLAGKDVIAQAQTGSGKTAAFGLPIIEAIDPKDLYVQALGSRPTCELAIQVAEALHKFGMSQGSRNAADRWRPARPAPVPRLAARCPHRGWHARPRDGPATCAAKPSISITSASSFSMKPTNARHGLCRTSEWIRSRFRPSAKPRVLLRHDAAPHRPADLASHERPERLMIPGSKSGAVDPPDYYEVPRMRQGRRADPCSTPKVLALDDLLPHQAGRRRSRRGADGAGLRSRTLQAIFQAQRDRVMSNTVPAPPPPWPYCFRRRNHPGAFAWAPSGSRPQPGDPGHRAEAHGHGGCRRRSRRGGAGRRAGRQGRSGYRVVRRRAPRAVPAAPTCRRATPPGRCRSPRLTSSTDPTQTMSRTEAACPFPRHRPCAHLSASRPLWP